MIRESLLPDFASADLLAHRVRVASFDALHRTFQRDMERGREQQVDMVRHENECMQLELSLSPIVIQRFQKQPRVRFHHKESSALEGGEGYEVRSGRRNQSSGFHQGCPSAAEAGRSKDQPNVVRLKVAPFPVS
jgi:hypothetical protein